MNTYRTRTRLTLIAAALLTSSAAFATTMSRTEYSAAKSPISATYKTEKAACGKFSGNQKDICKLQAEGKKKIAMADLEYQYTGKREDGIKVSVAKSDAGFAVAKEMCDDKAGNAKDVCVQEAKAAHTKSLANAKLASKVGEAQQDAVADKRDADYKVAIEKCDGLGGDAKSACVSSAKASFGKH